MLILNRDGSKKDWPSKVDMNKVLETPLPMIETNAPTKELSLEELKKQFNKGAKLEFFSTKKNSWQPCPNPTWKITTKYRVVFPPPKKYKTVEHYTENKENSDFIVALRKQNGDYRPSGNPFIHHTNHSAQKEAQRLAKKFPGNTYVVFPAEYSVSYFTEQIEVNDE